MIYWVSGRKDPFVEQPYTHLGVEKEGVVLIWSEEKLELMLKKYFGLLERLNTSKTSLISLLFCMCPRFLLFYLHEFPVDGS